MRVVQTPKHKFATPFSLYLGPGKSNSKPFCESTLFDPMVSSRASPSGSLLSSKMAEINKALMNSATGSRLRALRVVLHRVNDGFDMTSTMAAAMSATKEECAEARSLVNVLIQQYSAEKQDEALLPISSFQRLLKTADPRAVSMVRLESLRDDSSQISMTDHQNVNRQYSLSHYCLRLCSLCLRLEWRQSYHLFVLPSNLARATLLHGFVKLLHILYFRFGFPRLPRRSHWMILKQFLISSLTLTRL